MKATAIFKYGLFLAGVLVITACGITAPSRNEGYADFDSLGYRDVDSTMSLSIGPSILRLVAIGNMDDPHAQALLGGVTGVRVKAYDIIGDEERVFQRIDAMRRDLQEDGWVPVVQVQEVGERTVMLIKTRGEHIVGLTVLTSDRREAVMVNVLGELQPEMFAEAMVALDIDVPARRAEVDLK